MTIDVEMATISLEPLWATFTGYRNEATQTVYAAVVADFTEDVTVLDEAVKELLMYHEGTRCPTPANVHEQMTRILGVRRREAIARVAGCAGCEGTGYIPVPLDDPAAHPPWCPGPGCHCTAIEPCPHCSPEPDGYGQPLPAGAKPTFDEGMALAWDAYVAERTRLGKPASKRAFGKWMTGVSRPLRAVPEKPWDHDLDERF